MLFDDLVESIQYIHQTLQVDSLRAVNRNLTLRNWLIGFYIITFEQGGEDRAAYGEQLLQKLALRLDADGFSHRNLKLYRQFYQLYSPVGKLAFPLIKDIPQIGQTVSAQLDSWQAIEKVGLPIEQVMAKISFSHLVELMAIEDAIKRAFYEIETIKGNWAVRELRRQMNTLYFERMGLSKDLPKLSEYVQSKAVQLTPRDIIQSPFTFEFLGLKAPDVLSEHDLEKQVKRI